MTYFTTLIEVARYLKNNIRYRPIVYFSFHYPTIDKDVNTCKREKIQYIIGYSAKESSTLTNWLNFILNSNFFTSFIKKVLEYKKEFRLVRKVIDKVRPSLLILAGDNVGYNTSIFIKVGHRKNIPSIIHPSWMAGAREAAEAYYDDPRFDCKRVLNHLVSLFYPNWVYSHRGKKMLRWPAATLLALKLFKIDPPRPWALNSGHADIITAESKAMYEYMIRAGLPPKQIRITGSLFNDILAQNIKDSVNKKKEKLLNLELDPGKLIILCALPPDQLYGLGRKECEFKIYKDLVEFWLQSIAKINKDKYNIIISLHPSVKKGEMDYIEKWGVKIADEKIANLIPLCDIFIASISATIQWAIACGIPVLNYDVYKYRYHDYNSVKGVINVETKNDFLKYLKKFIKSWDFYTLMRKNQQICMKQWGILDGQSGVRILQLCDKLVSNK